jgi:hypothetical protein
VTHSSAGFDRRMDPAGAGPGRTSAQSEPSRGAGAIRAVTISEEGHIMSAGTATTADQGSTVPAGTVTISMSSAYGGASGEATANWVRYSSA